MAPGKHVIAKCGQAKKAACSARARTAPGATTPSWDRLEYWYQPLKGVGMREVGKAERRGEMPSEGEEMTNWCRERGDRTNNRKQNQKKGRENNRVGIQEKTGGAGGIRDNGEKEQEGN